MVKDDSTAPGKWPEVGHCTAAMVNCWNLGRILDGGGGDRGWSCLEVVTGNWGYLMVVVRW